jgi:hypothetical protein
MFGLSDIAKQEPSGVWSSKRPRTVVLCRLSTKHKIQKVSCGLWLVACGKTRLSSPVARRKPVAGCMVGQWIQLAVDP